MKRNCLHKNEVLSGKKNFNDLFMRGNFIKGKLVNIIYTEADEFKVGFAVLKKIKSSINKNKIKRQLREIYRTNKLEFSQKKIILIIGKKNKVVISDLKDEIISILKTIK